LTKEFNKFYPEYGAQSLADMAQCLGVARKPDSVGIENCKVISNIIASVLREGYAFLEPEWIPVTFDPFVPPSMAYVVDPMMMGGRGAAWWRNRNAPKWWSC
jgi:hypothetical protein